MDVSLCKGGVDMPRKYYYKHSSSYKKKRLELLGLAKNKGIVFISKILNMLY
jgi:hypothetical protein